MGSETPRVLWALFVPDEVLREEAARLGFGTRLKGAEVDQLREACAARGLDGSAAALARYRTAQRTSGAGSATVTAPRRHRGGEPPPPTGQGGLFR